jgi:hypothetical protein
VFVSFTRLMAAAVPSHLLHPAIAPCVVWKELDTLVLICMSSKGPFQGKYPSFKQAGLVTFDKESAMTKELSPKSGLPVLRQKRQEQP